MKLGLMLLPSACFACAAFANPAGEIGYPKGSLGYDALIKANYAAAERQILSDNRTSRNDPAKLINLGQIYWKTGRADEAIRVLEAVAQAEEVELILANGKIIGSRDAARKALATIRR